MEEQFAMKSNRNWVRCESKSRPNHYYMFNAKTGETQWCTVATEKAQQNISAKCKMKTPAQDRLKCLQKCLEKKRKDSSIVKAKDGSKNKRFDFSHKETVEAIKESLTVNKLSSKNVKDVVAIKREKAEEKKAIISKQSVEKSKSHSQIEKDSPVAAEEPKNIVQSDKDKFRIPKKSNSQPEKSSKKNKTTKRKLNDVMTSNCSFDSTKNQLFYQSTSDSSGLKKEITNACSPKKIRTSNEFETNEEKISPDSEKKLECDFNDNINPSKEQKVGIMTVLKDYCSSLFKKKLNSNIVNNPDIATEQSDLLSNSRPSFKSKNTGPKVSLQENQSRRTPPNAQSRSSTRGCANDRLQRLRRSLQLQQTFVNRTQPTSDSIAASSSSYSVCSPSPSQPVCESMDWQPICMDSPLHNNTTSTSLSNISSPNVSTCSENYDTVNENLLRLAADKKQQEKNRWKTDYFYFVVDTNVFLENVTFVDELTSMKLCDTAGTLIYVPYCVLQELDKLKIRSPSESIKTRSTRAIQFINKAFQKKSQHIQAQSSADENKHLIRVTSPDDSILNCCLQVKEHIENVMLLTEDINLRNKAMCSDILVSTKSDLISKHESLL